MISNDVWIGQNVTIMPGVKIADGAIIAANATVVKDVETYTIVGGNPAKAIKKRFSDEKIELLLKIQWWNWDETYLNIVIKMPRRIFSRRLYKSYTISNHE